MLFELPLRFGIPKLLEYKNRAFVHVGTYNSTFFYFLFSFFSWVEDKIVADRLSLISENIVALIKHWEAKPKSKRPSSRSYENFKVSVNHPLTFAKLQFFFSLAGVLEPFLKP